MTWRDDEWYMSGGGKEPANWSTSMARELDIIHLLNSEAKYLKILVVSIQSSFDGHVSRETREKRLAQLESLKGGVMFVAGTVQERYGIRDDETMMMMQDLMKKLNLERA